MLLISFIKKALETEGSKVRAMAEGKAGCRRGRGQGGKGSSWLRTFTRVERLYREGEI